MNAPRHDLAAFLETRFPGARVEPMAGDASTRRFYRVTARDGTTRVIMDHGAPFDGETDDVRLARVFASASLPVASVQEVAPAIGCIVLEDLGNRSLERVLDESDDDARRRWLEDAVDLAARIAVAGTDALERSERRSGPALDADRFRFEMAFFLERYVAGFREVDAQATGLEAPLFALADRAAASPRVFCHRDYHSRNLMVRGDGSLAMVDIQDARWGPESYDLASLLRDAYADIDEPLVEALLDRYRSALPDPPPADRFRARFHDVAAQRMIKALGTFGDQIRNRGREDYRPAVDRTVRRLAVLLPRDPGTAEIAERLDAFDLLGDRFIF